MFSCFEGKKMINSKASIPYVISITPIQLAQVDNYSYLLYLQEQEMQLMSYRSNQKKLESEISEMRADLNSHVSSTSGHNGITQPYRHTTIASPNHTATPQQHHPTTPPHHNSITQPHRHSITQPPCPPQLNYLDED